MLTLRGESKPPAVALEQPCAHPRLQLRDVAADRGLGRTQLLGRAAEAEMPAAIAEQQSLLDCCPVEDVQQKALHGAHKKVIALLNLA